MLALFLLQESLAAGGGAEKARLTKRPEKILQQQAATREMLLSSAVLLAVAVWLSLVLLLRCGVCSYSLVLLFVSRVFVFTGVDVVAG